MKIVEFLVETRTKSHSKRENEWRKRKLQSSSFHGADTKESKAKIFLGAWNKLGIQKAIHFWNIKQGKCGVWRRVSLRIADFVT